MLLLLFSVTAVLCCAEAAPRVKDVVHFFSRLNPKSKF